MLYIVNRIAGIVNHSGGRKTTRTHRITALVDGMIALVKSYSSAL